MHGFHVYFYIFFFFYHFHFVSGTCDYLNLDFGRLAGRGQVLNEDLWVRPP